MHKLNEFLACEPRGSYIRTGTLYRKAVDYQDEVWVCMTPECDMVPREVTSGWRGKLHPVRPIMAVAGKIRLVKPEDMLHATKSRLLFIKTPEDRMSVIELIDHDSREPRTELMFIENQGVLTKEGTFTAHRVHFGMAPAPAQYAVKMQVIGQMRAIYANRLLQQTGQYLSRVGVDFVNLPETSIAPPPPPVAPPVVQAESTDKAGST